MANFSIVNSTAGVQQNLSASYISLLSVYCSTTGTAGLTRRGKIYDILIGTDGTPADNYVEWNVQRVSSPSTGTPVTANSLDLADTAVASGTVANSTTEGTFSSSGTVWYVGVNQRASYRWVAAPGSELVWPATSSAGFALRARSGGYTGTATGNLLCNEQ